MAPSASNIGASTGKKPTIMVLSLRNFHETIFKTKAFKHIRAGINIRVASNYTAVSKILGYRALVRNRRGPRRPRAVFILDSAVVRDEHRDIFNVILQYVRDGGSCVLMGDFAANDDLANDFFQRVGLPWRRGTHKVVSRFVLNRGGDSLSLRSMFTDGLERGYFQRVTRLDNVSSEHAWYIAPDKCQTVEKEGVCACPNENHVFAAGSAMAKVGAGLVGYVGDDLFETHNPYTRAAILAMCRLVAET